MGVVPLQFPEGQSEEPRLDGTEIVSIEGLEELNSGTTPKTGSPPRASSRPRARRRSSSTRVRIDTPGEADYYRNGGILQYVLRSLV
jgi:aconitate hydratase